MTECPPAENFLAFRYTLRTLRIASLPESPPMRIAPQRFLLTLVPAALLVAVAASAIWGDNGLLVRRQLDAQLDQAQEELAGFDRENERLLRDVRAMETDPVVVERMVADELGWGHDGAVLVRFDER